MHPAEGQRERLRTYVSITAVILWGCDVLQQWNTQINISAYSEVEHKSNHVSGKYVIRYYKKNSLQPFRLYKSTQQLAKLQMYQWPYI